MTSHWNNQHWSNSLNYSRKSHPSQFKWTDPRLTQNCRTGRPRCVRGRPARLASWETRRASRDHADVFLSTGSCTGTHNYSTRWSHNAPEIHDTLRRAASTADAVLLATLLFQAPLPLSVSLSLFLGSCSSAPQERGGGDWEPLYFSPLLPCRLSPSSLHVSLQSYFHSHLPPLLSSQNLPHEQISQSMLARSHLLLISLLAAVTYTYRKETSGLFLLIKPPASQIWSLEKKDWVMSHVSRVSDKRSQHDRLWVK